MPLKEELTAASAARAAGMIVMFKFLDSYFEPHQGVHYRLPAMFVKADEASLLKAAAVCSAIATLSVNSEVTTAPTRSIFGTLLGQTAEPTSEPSEIRDTIKFSENGPVAPQSKRVETRLKDHSVAKGSRARREGRPSRTSNHSSNYTPQEKIMTTNTQIKTLANLVKSLVKLMEE
ncbi:hypothetical protein VE02_09505 [Pseudogymnoascus sp. 03VT05]|nr:hypothetical protein VE02_09505 [Pseudogymnoascus sp. 03VT05]